MQQIWGVVYGCEDCACMLHIISLRAQISQNVKYWYEICDVLVPIFMRGEELVPIFHSVKFAKCEICGSTKLPTTLYWLPKPHKRPYKSCFIAYSSPCTTTEFPIGILGQVWCLILSISDLYPLSYFLPCCD